MRREKCGVYDISLLTGPDICGPGTKKVHVILTYKEKVHLIKKDIRCKVRGATGGEGDKEFCTLENATVLGERRQQHAVLCNIQNFILCQIFRMTQGARHTREEISQWIDRCVA